MSSGARDGVGHTEGLDQEGDEPSNYRISVGGMGLILKPVVPGGRLPTTSSGEILAVGSSVADKAVGYRYPRRDSDTKIEARVERWCGPVRSQRRREVNSTYTARRPDARRRTRGAVQRVRAAMSQLTGHRHRTPPNGAGHWRDSSAKHGRHPGGTEAAQRDYLHVERGPIGMLPLWKTIINLPTWKCKSDQGTTHKVSWGITVRLGSRICTNYMNSLGSWTSQSYL